MRSWLRELTRLEQAIRAAKRPVNRNDPKPLSNFTKPIDDAGVHGEAEALLQEILRGYEGEDEAGRRALRDLVPRFRSFFQWTAPPKAGTAADTLRARLIHFALIDQYPDPRDAVTMLNAVCQRTR